MAEYAPREPLDRMNTLTNHHGKVLEKGGRTQLDSAHQLRPLHAPRDSRQRCPKSYSQAMSFAFKAICPSSTPGMSTAAR